MRLQYWTIQTLAPCCHPTVDPPSPRLRRTAPFLSIDLFSFTSWSCGLQILLLYRTLLFVAWLSFVGFRPIWKSTLHLRVTRCAAFFYCSTFHSHFHFSLNLCTAIIFPTCASSGLDKPRTLLVSIFVHQEHHKLRCVVFETIGTGCPPSTECRIRACSLYRMVQQHYCNCTFVFCLYTFCTLQ